MKKILKSTTGKILKSSITGKVLSSLPPYLDYGLHYNGYAALEENLLPVDWDLPTIQEYTDLVTFLGGNSLAGGTLKETGEVYWTSNVDANNSSGFTGLGAGYRSTILFELVKGNAYFWCIEI